MINTKSYPKTFAVMEHLPWLESPRILFEVETEDEARAEAAKLNGIPNSQSTFYVSEVIRVTHFDVFQPHKYSSPITIGNN